MLFVAVGTPTYAQGEKPSSDEIWYTTTDGKVVNPNNPEAFGSKIISNTYRNGKGVIIVEGDCIVEIGKEAFRGCRNLKSITIPDSVTEIELDAFYGCSSLTDTYVNITDLAAYATGNMTSVFHPGAKHLMIDDTEITELVIPDGVTWIGDWAFRGCSSLTSVTIPDSVTSIGRSAFEGCTSLTNFYGKFASEDGRCLIVDGKLVAFAPFGLTQYSIPDIVTSIGYKAFSGCTSLTSITIPDSVTKIEYDAFYGCSSLTKVYCKPTTPPSGNWSMFGSNASGRKIYVPRGSVNAYKNAEYWSDYADDIVGYDF